jgi:hypothetical protein
MNKIMLGLLVGGILGIFDGLSAWFTPAVRAQLLGIVIGSTVKGLIAGVLIGYFAKKVNSLPWGLLFGLTIGLLLAYAVAAMPDPTGKHYYFEIMLPGGIVGMIVVTPPSASDSPCSWPASSRVAGTLSAGFGFGFAAVVCLLLKSTSKAENKSVRPSDSRHQASQVSGGECGCFGCAALMICGDWQRLFRRGPRQNCATPSR